MRRINVSSLAVAFASAACFVVALAAQDEQSIRSPGGHSVDSFMAVNHPEEYAWQLFFSINQQAATGLAGKRDISKPFPLYDADQPVVWETWAQSSGGAVNGKLTCDTNTSEVFLNRGAKPLRWKDFPRANLSKRGYTLEYVGDAPANQTNYYLESRMNEDTFEFVRQHNLYSVEGLEAEYWKETHYNPLNRAPFALPLSFPRGSQEIKAAWVVIQPWQRSRFHWRTAIVKDENDKDTAVILGLASLHVSTKDTPFWFWCDFEQEGFSKRDQNNFPQWLPDSVTPQWVSSAVRHTKWEHYVLRGAQTTFTGPEGENLQLGNTVIEQYDYPRSSCISCHAFATVRQRDPNSPKHIGGLDPERLLGVPDPDLFKKVIQTDFVWSIPFRALSTHYDPDSKHGMIRIDSNSAKFELPGVMVPR